MASFRDCRKGFDRLVKELTRRMPDVTVGVHSGDAAQTPGEYGGPSVGEIAEAHEFGLGVPQRSFIRGWVDEIGRAKFSAAVRAELEDAVKHDRSTEVALERLALTLQASIQKRISDGIEPALDPKTIARKGGFTTPLVHHGILKSAVIAKVNGKKVS